MDRASRFLDRKKSRSRIQTSSGRKSSSTKATLWSLPQEVLLHLFQDLHIKELLNICCAHPYFYDLISNNPSVWQNVSFNGNWPTIPNMRHFMKAAEHSNIEALVKLGVAFLYNEGLPGDFEGKKITANGERAAEMFCKVEACTPNVSPFTWLFIRPPWAVAGACCKECVFTNMKEYVSKTPDPSIHICIAKTMGILGVDEYKEDIRKNLAIASDLGSQEAAFLMWNQKYCECCTVLDNATDLASLRELRKIAMAGYYEGQLTLCKRYAKGKYGGIAQTQAVHFIRDFIQSSKPTRVKKIYRFNELTHSMRYILMDWLVEVACMKDFSSITLHMAVCVVDRFLQKHKTTRAKLQLLGVAAMVLCSRVLCTDIITIREAAWLTDNTYKYEDVVRMMGEITATLGGKFRMPVSLDYVELLNAAAESDKETGILAEYFCELALLQSDMGDFPMAEVAASCAYLARIVRKKEKPWPADMVACTGYSCTDLHRCMLLLHDKCFMDQAMVDHRDVVLQAVKERYSDEEFMSVSDIKVMNKADLRTSLGVPDDFPADVILKDNPKSPMKERVASPKDLIASPCRGTAGKISMDSSTIDLDRGNAGTPTLQAMQRAAVSKIAPTSQSSSGAVQKRRENSGKLNVSISGYDGDREDEGESFIDLEGYDSDQDLESLWCTDRRWTESQSRVDLSSNEEDCSFQGPVPLTSYSNIPDCRTSKSSSSSQLVGSASMPIASFTFGGTKSSVPSTLASTSNMTSSGLWNKLNSGLTPLSISSKLPTTSPEFCGVNQLNRINIMTRSRVNMYDDTFMSSPIDSGIEMNSGVPSSAGTPSNPGNSCTTSCAVPSHSPVSTSRLGTGRDTRNWAGTPSEFSTRNTRSKSAQALSDSTPCSSRNRSALGTLSTVNCDTSEMPRPLAGKKRKLPTDQSLTRNASKMHVPSHPQ